MLSFLFCVLVVLLMTVLAMMVMEASWLVRVVSVCGYASVAEIVGLRPDNVPHLALPPFPRGSGFLPPSRELALSLSFAVGSPVTL